MWSYFKLLFSRNYWRLLLRGHTWRETGLAFGRAHKDKRARKQLRLALTLILTPFLCIFWVLLLLAQTAAGTVGFTLVVAAIAGVVAAIIRRNAKRTEEKSLSLFGPNETLLDKPAKPRPVSEAVRLHLRELTLLHAVLANRAGSESFLQTKALPPDMEVTTRRNHVALLKQHGMWDRLGPQERDLLLLPDGHWTPDAVNQAAFLLEPLRILRWALRLDEFLPVVGSTLQLDYKMASTTVEEADDVLKARRTIAPEPLETALRAANAYFQRCAAEGVKRGLFPPESKENETWSLEYANQMAGRESDDLLLGNTIVAAAGDATIHHAAILSLRRVRMLDWLKHVLVDGLEPGDDLRVLSARFDEQGVDEQGEEAEEEM